LTELGESTSALVSSVLHALEAIANDDRVNPNELSAGLKAISAVAQRKADEFEKQMYRAGDNYGFSGAADTYAEIYRYQAAYVRVVASAAALDVDRCISAFRAALKLYGMYSVDGDPKGAIGQAIEEADDTAASALDAAYAAVPEASKQQTESPSAEQSAQPVPVKLNSVPATCTPERHHVFISYSHHDKKWFAELLTMLSPLVRSGAIDVWNDTMIKPGAAWKEEIEKALQSAKVAVLLVSGEFLDSDFIHKKELPPLLRAAREDGVTIFWIYVDTCLYEATSISDFQAAHDISRPLSRMSKAKRREVIAEICRGIKDSIS
jgi:hypothetical protein